MANARCAPFADQRMARWGRAQTQGTRTHVTHPTHVTAARAKCEPTTVPKQRSLGGQRGPDLFGEARWCN
eukprot:5645556-Alexandrium_andersonii.AAC.1